MTSIPVHAIIVSNVTADWGVYTLLTGIPTYMKEVLKFDIAAVSLFLFCYCHCCCFEELFGGGD